MANWCSGRLVVKGDPAICQNFIQTAREDINSAMDDVLCASNFIPLPSNTPIDWQGKYTWCVNNWGSRSGFADSCLIGRFPVTYVFSSAWSAMTPTIAAMGAFFPELEFTYIYDEAGNNFAGKMVVAGGEVVENKSWDLYGNEHDEDEYLPSP